MRVTIKNMRTGILLLAGLLVLALVSFFVYAKFQMRRFGKDLPGKLGLQIQQSANGFTISKTDKNGKVILTVHAAKEVQYKDGRASLHDTSITLYSPDGTRADRIYGSDFDYDQSTQVATAKGEVQIDLASPTAKSKQPNGASSGDAGVQTIHVKTSGLVFDQKTGVATTPDALEFRLPKAAGTAVGATYDSQLGILILDRAVEITSETDGTPLRVHAGHAQFLRDSRQVFLINPTTEFQREKTSSDQAIVYFRPDGSAEHVDAKGHIHLQTDAGQTLHSQSAKVLLDNASEPTRADLAGGVLFTSEDAVHHMSGNAVEATLQFSRGPALHHAQLRNAVSFVDQQAGLPGDPRASSNREIRAATLDIDFAPGQDNRVLTQKLLATGDATVVLHSISTTGPQQNTTIAADRLLATLANGNSITALDGSGHTRLVTTSPNGASQTGTGDTLQIAFAPTNAALPGKPAGRKNRKPTTSGEVLESPTSRLQSAVQQGNVTLTQIPPNVPHGTAQASAPMHVTAQRAEYHTADQLVHLAGHPRLNDGSLDLSADAIDYRRDTGEAIANGDVKATYLQTAAASPTSLPTLGGQGPAHVIARAATMNRVTGEAIFRGKARLWQGTNSVAAPIIELSHARSTLHAHGEGAAAEVNATLAMASDPKHPPSVIGIQGRDLLYSDAQRQARFRGSVVAQDSSGTIRSDQADVRLAPVGATGQKSGPNQIDELTATGHVILQQPGRKGLGEKLVYTQQDGRCVLSGNTSDPPRLTDQVHGTVTGASLIFNTRDDSVSVNGGQSNAITDTRVPR